MLAILLGMEGPVFNLVRNAVLIRCSFLSRPVPGKGAALAYKQSRYKAESVRWQENGSSTRCEAAYIKGILTELDATGIGKLSKTFLIYYLNEKLFESSFPVIIIKLLSWVQK